jgi:crotonobetainyl-CoA:carnitine CoA-transferase CaiB-like acyl-CoA transferase
LGREPTSNRSQTAAPSDIYKTKDGWIVIAVNGDPLFRRAARVIGAPEWIGDPRFSSDKARGDNGAAISAHIQEWCATRTSAEAIAAFEAARVPAGPLYTMRQALDDPHVRKNDIFTNVDFPGIGEAPVAATPVKLHGTPGEVRRRAPTLGEHNDEILHELGYSVEEIGDLRRSGAV